MKIRNKKTGEIIEVTEDQLTDYGLTPMAKGGMIKRADGSYSRRGLWDNIRANKGSGKKPTKEMLKQEKKIRAAEKAYGGYMASGGCMECGGKMQEGGTPLPSYNFPSLIKKPNPADSAEYQMRFNKAFQQDPSVLAEYEKMQKYGISQSLPKDIYKSILLRQNAYQDALNQIAEKEDGGKLPKEILKARLESHMSSDQAKNYLDKYQKGGKAKSKKASDEAMNEIASDFNRRLERNAINNAINSMYGPPPQMPNPAFTNLPYYPDPNTSLNELLTPLPYRPNLNESMEEIMTPYAEGGYLDQAGDGKWIQKAINPKHKGYCTPMTKSTCTPRRKALARTLKKMAKSRKDDGGLPMAQFGDEQGLPYAKPNPFVASNQYMLDQNPIESMGLKTPSISEPLNTKINSDYVYLPYNQANNIGDNLPYRPGAFQSDDNVPYTYSGSQSDEVPFMRTRTGTESPDNTPARNELVQSARRMGKRERRKFFADYNEGLRNEKQPGAAPTITPPKSRRFPGLKNLNFDFSQLANFNPLSMLMGSLSGINFGNPYYNQMFRPAYNPYVQYNYNRYYKDGGRLLMAADGIDLPTASTVGGNEISLGQGSDFGSNFWNTGSNVTGQQPSVNQLAPKEYEWKVGDSEKSRISSEPINKNNIFKDALDIANVAIKGTKGALYDIGNEKVNAAVRAGQAKQSQISMSETSSPPPYETQGYDWQGRNALPVTAYGGYAADGMQVRDIGGKGTPTVEVEDGEHIEFPNKFSQEVRGKKHSEGGIPLNLPQGTKIFSEKLKDPETKKSYADLAKKFETKKYVDLLNSKSADPIQKATAQMMIDQNAANLEKIFMLQEQNKLSGAHGADVQQKAMQEQQQAMAQEQAPMQEPMMAHGGRHLPKFQNAGNQNKPQYQFPLLGEAGSYYDTGYNFLDDIELKKAFQQYSERGDNFFPYFAAALEKGNLMLNPIVENWVVKGQGKTKEGTYGDISARDVRNLEKQPGFSFMGEIAKKYGQEHFDPENPKMVRDYEESVNKAYEEEGLPPYFQNLTDPSKPFSKEQKFGNWHASVAPIIRKSIGAGKTEDSSEGPIQYVVEKLKGEKKKKEEEEKDQKITPETITETKYVRPEIGLDMAMGIPLPEVYGRDPLNYYKIEPTYIDPRYLDIQPQLNRITRGQRAIMSNIGSRGSADMANLLAAQANADIAAGEAFGQKHVYDRAQDAAAQQANAQAKAQADQYNQQSWFQQLEDPIRRREGAIDTQKRTDAQQELENMRKMQAFYANKGFIGDTFYPLKNMTGEQLLSILPPALLKQFNEEQKEKKRKYGGKVKIKPKFRK